MERSESDRNTVENMSVHLHDSRYMTYSLEVEAMIEI